MKTYVLVDTFNMAFRAKNVVYNADIDTQIGMSFHIIFNSLAKVWKMFEPHNVVACFEGHSWRKSVNSSYKANRAEDFAKKTAREQEDSKIFLEALNSFKGFLEEKTNVTVLQHKKLEADDLIAFWIQQHPNDEHVIISSDSDFIQLLAPNVKIYDGIKNILISIDSVVSDNGKPVLDKKTKKEMVAPDPEWQLFYKCIRGDTSDNVFPAYPGAREKGTKNKVGMREAFEDRKNKGYAHNNFMLQKWTDENQIEHRVLDRFLDNALLIDLTKQPQEIKQHGIDTISSAKERPRTANVGFNLMKFCSTWDLKKIADYPDTYAKLLNAHVGDAT